MSAADTNLDQLDAAKKSLELALPAPGGNLEQDKEWVIVRVDDDWRQIRLHDYGDVYAVPGLYERWVYDIFRCKSPEKIRELLAECLDMWDVDPASLHVLDLGAGNGCVAEELRELGIEDFVGVDIYENARRAAERDRPGLYGDYVVGDMTNLTPEQKRTLDRHELNCLACVAALGFGDIPPEVFAAAFNEIAPGGWVVFTIKKDFVDPADPSGFSRLIRHMLTEGIVELAARELYVHRVSTEGQELHYTAFVTRKRKNIEGFEFRG